MNLGLEVYKNTTNRSEILLYNKESILFYLIQRNRNWSIKSMELIFYTIKFILHVIKQYYMKGEESSRELGNGEEENFLYILVIC